MDHTAVRASYTRLLEQNADMTDRSALEMALLFNIPMPSTSKYQKRNTVGGFNPSYRAPVSELVGVVIRRTGGDSQRAMVMACEYLGLAFHLSTHINRAHNLVSRTQVLTRWTTILSLVLSDEDRLDVVDHLSSDGIIPLELVSAMYVS
mgnify:CR=1 FL=1